MVARVLLMAVFAVSLLLGVAPARAQEATPGAALDLPEWVQAWITTQEEEDLFGFTDLYTGDATYEVLGDAAMVYDKISIREVAGFHAADTNDFTISPTAFYAGDGWAILEYTMGWVTSNAAKTPVTDIRAATVFILNDEGLITRSSDYYDGYAVSEDLGYEQFAGRRS
ncbi:MAG: hypothetical protein QM692_09190 [Thermomicrobiales bacterium]